jgi:hypothetical protein
MMSAARMLRTTGAAVLGLAVVTVALVYGSGALDNALHGPPAEKLVGGHALALDVTRTSLAQGVVLYNTRCERLTEGKALAGGNVECLAEAPTGAPIGLKVTFKGVDGEYVLEQV